MLRQRSRSVVYLLLSMVAAGSALALASICEAQPVASARSSTAATSAAAFRDRFEAIKRDASPAELYRLLYQLPKGGDIHHHLSLSFLATDLWDAATNPTINKGNEFYTRIRVSACPSDVTLPLRFANAQRSIYMQLPPCEKDDYVSLASLTPTQRAEWLSALHLDRDGEGRNEFFEAVANRVPGLTRNIEVFDFELRRLLTRLGREKVRYVETQVGWNGFYDNSGAALTPAAFTARLRQILASPEAKASGVTMRFQAVAIRFAPDAEKQLTEAYQLVAQNRDLFVGVNMAGREDNDKGNALRFLPVLRQLRRTYAGVHLSIHAGEKDVAGPEVRNTLLLGAERIGHGFNIILDPDTMLLLRNSRTLVEVSLVSNNLLEYAPDLAAHPFVEYLRTGIPVCLNTDDAGSWDSQLTDDYVLAVQHFNLTWDEIVQLGRNSLRFSFADEPTKTTLMNGYEEAVKAFERRYSTPDWRTALAGTADTVVSGYAARKLHLR